jgi:glutamine amidotransferase
VSRQDDAGPVIGVVDYGMGNRRSVEKALERAGASPVVTADHDVLRAADGLVLPGVGSFPRAMANLGELGLDEVLRERLIEGVPLLGLCLGMQLAFERSTENGGGDGLGILAGTVEPLATGGRKLPHIGWSPVRWRMRGALNAGLRDGAAFYHVHSYVAAPADADDVLGLAHYGSQFVTAVARPPFFGVQFHPEKSSRDGLALLANFAAMCAEGARRPAARA